MKTKVFTAILATCLLPYLAYAGPGEGGGGDASEMRVNEIRGDLLNWLNSGEFKGLKLPAGLTAKSYREKMQSILSPHAVVVGFVTAEQERKASDPELKVTVDGHPKTCRGFTSRRSAKPNILCQVERFKALDDIEQYKLIHHEYAGLADVEHNKGASSDYEVSNQLAQFLAPKTVRRLGVSGKTVTVEGTIAKSIIDAAMELEFQTDGGMGRLDFELTEVVCDKLSDKDYSGTGELCRIGSEGDQGRKNFRLDASKAETGPWNDQLKKLENQLATFRLALATVIPDRIVKTSNGFAKRVQVKSLKCHTAGIGHEYDDIRNERPFECVIEKK